MQSKRPSKDWYYIGIAKEVSKRATCLRRKIGAILVVDDEIRATGYCGSPRGAKNCVDLGFCIRQRDGIPSGERYEYCKSVHAEQNVLISAARRDIIGGTMYISGEDLVGDLKSKNPNVWIEPCSLCKKMIINAGVVRVVAGDPNSDLLEFKVTDWLKEENYMTYGNKKLGRIIRKNRGEEIGG